METRKNIYIAVFVITTIIASCLAVYFKITSDNNIFYLNNQIEELKSANSAKKTEIEVKEVEKIQKVQMTASEKFKVFSDSLKKEIESFGINDKLKGGIDDPFKQSGFTSIYVNSKKEVLIQPEYGETIKILDNGINCGMICVGNGGITFLIWAIDVNGDLYTMIYNSSEPTDNLSLVKDESKKNIVYVMPKTGLSVGAYVCIDIDGNVY